jgi:ABC-2 type transport system permease protein
MTGWWGGTVLVLKRNLLENLRSRTYKVITGVLVLISLGVVVLPQVFGEEETTYTLATVGPAPAEVKSLLGAAAEGGDFTVEYETVADEEELRRVVQEGDATAGLGEDRLYTSTVGSGTFPVLVSQAVVAVETRDRLSEAGLTAAEIAAVQSVSPPEQVPVGRVDDEDRAGVGFAVGIVLYIALTFAGSAIATAVAMEKSTRISEVLLAVLRPSQIVVGTVAAVGVATILQLLLLVAPLAVAVQVTDDLGLPLAATWDIGLAVIWFVLGFAVFAFMFAASAAMVDKITEANAAVVPVSMVLLVGYMLGVTVVANDPTSRWSAAISMFPFSAPVAMPIRWASGEVPVYQLVVAMVLTALTAVLLVAASATVYRRALLVTGRRARLRELLRAPAPASRG